MTAMERHGVEEERSSCVGGVGFGVDSLVALGRYTLVGVRTGLLIALRLSLQSHTEIRVGVLSSPLTLTSAYHPCTLVNAPH
jgi:hypothetical protein